MSPKLECLFHSFSDENPDTGHRSTRAFPDVFCQAAQKDSCRLSMFLQCSREAGELSGSWDSMFPSKKQSGRQQGSLGNMMVDVS